MNEPAAISTPVLIAIYGGLIILASLAGGWLPIAAKLTHTRLQVAISFVAGLMLGVGLLHMLPHAWHQFRSIDRAVLWLLAGFLVMFFAQRFFHFHHHDVPDEAAEHDHFSHSDHEHCEHSLAEQSARRLSWVGAAVGMTLHSLIDGVALAASVQAEAEGSGVRGLGAFLVILLHKPFDAMAISTLMRAGGRSKYTCHLVNGLFAVAIPVGVALFHLGVNQSGSVEGEVLGAALAFAAGTFLCIATSDLLPEIQFHTHDRFKLSFALMAGLGLAVLIGRFETSGHDHHHDDNKPSAAQAHGPRRAG
jgi:zinc and cadmium transporter